MSGSPELLAEELLYEIEQQIAAHPRSLQKRIGPSEIGVPCARQLAYKLAGVPEVQARVPAQQWLPTVGTAVHTWLEAALEAANARWVAESGDGKPRYLIEERVIVGQIGGDDIDGCTDVFDTVTCNVVDWKIVGPTRLKEYRRHGPGAQYRMQGHLYGRGWQRRGYDVDSIVIAFLPRNAPDVRDAYFWHEKYDEQVALDALQRANRIDALLKVYGLGSLEMTNIDVYNAGLSVLVEDNLNGLARPAIPTDPHDCRYCPWLKPGSAFVTTSCPGDATRDSKPDSFLKSVLG